MASIATLLGALTIIAVGALLYCCCVVAARADRRGP